jgi:sporulation-control protein spo0M
MFSIALNDRELSPNNDSDMSISSTRPESPSSLSSLEYITPEQLPPPVELRSSAGFSGWPAVATLEDDSEEDVHSILGPATFPRDRPIQERTIPQINYIKVDDDSEEEEIERTFFVPSPFTKIDPAKVKIDIETQMKIDKEGNEKTHNHLEVEAKMKAAEITQEAAFEASQLLEADCQTALYHRKARAALHAATNAACRTGDYQLIQDAVERFKAANKPPKQKGSDINDWEWTDSEESGWTHDDGLPKNWPSPPTTPPQGDDFHPPQLSVCGQHPGEDWIQNIPGTRDYYRFLIPDPATNKSIVAPFVRYTPSEARPEIWASYGKGFRNHIRNLSPTPVEYTCPPLSIDQGHVFDADASYAPAVDRVINTHFPRDLAAGVRQYQYYKSAQYSIQKTIRELQAKEMRYLERSCEVLSELEMANVLGRFLAHLDEAVEMLHEQKALQAHLQFAKCISGFSGQIPYNARTLSRPLLDTHVNVYAKDKLTPTQPRAFSESSTDSYRFKRCHLCRQVGHIRATCPKRRAPFRK